jgi:hypothetical protein
MKDIFSFEFTNTYRNNVIFDIVKDNKEKTYADKILTPKTFGLEIDEWLKNHGCKAVFNRIEKGEEK